MVNFFKRIVGVVICFCFAMLSFSGCSLWTLNQDKYLNQVVASYGEISVTLEDVYNAYYSYGNYYYDEQGAPTFNGIKTTAEQLLNREILLQYLKNGDSEGNGKIILTQNELNDVWEGVYKYINDAATSFETSLLEADGLSLPADATETEEDLEDYEREYAAYEKTYQYVNGKLEKIQKTPEDIEKFSQDIFQWTEEEMEGFPKLEDKLASLEVNEKALRAYQNFRSVWWEGKGHTEKNSKGELYSEKAWNKYISSLKSAESGKNLSTKSEEIFYRELDRLFDAHYESKIFTAFQENFEKDEAISESVVLAKYKLLREAQEETYGAITIQADSSKIYNNYVTAMKNRSAPIMWTVDESDWFQVSHILIKFSDQDIEDLKDLQTELSNDGISKADYDLKVKKIKDDVTVVDRETGEPVKASKVLEQLGEELQGKSSKSKIQIFNNYIYRYNMDAGANNADYAYYIPADENNDSMVTPFANASRELRAQGVGSISDLIEVNALDGYEDNDGNTQTPSYSGYHIVMYLGEISAPEVNTQKLNDHILNPLNNNDTNSKTMLDYVIEQITYSNYSGYEKSLLNQLKTEGSVNYYSAVLNELLAKFS